MLDNGHLILRERSGLVRTDNLCASERLNRRQAADHRLPLRHARDADREYDRDNRRKSLRDRRDCKRHRDHEGREHRLKSVIACSHQAENKNEHADPEDEL